MPIEALAGSIRPNKFLIRAGEAIQVSLKSNRRYKLIEISTNIILPCLITNIVYLSCF